MENDFNPNQFVSKTVADHPILAYSVLGWFGVEISQMGENHPLIELLRSRAKEEDARKANNLEGQKRRRIDNMWEPIETAPKDGRGIDVFCSAVMLDRDQVQRFLDSLGLMQMFTVKFIKKDGTERVIRGYLDPNRATRKAAVPVCTDEGWKSFRIDRVLEISAD